MLRSAFLCLFTLLLAQGVFSSNFDDQMSRISKNFYPDLFSHKNEVIELESSTLNLSFPHKSGEKVNAYPEISSPLAGKYVKVFGSEVIFKSDEVDINIKFILEGRSFVTVYIGSTVFTYIVNVPKKYLFDEYAPISETNIPAIPTGYFYQNNLLMKDLDQKYYYCTTDKEWSLTVDAPVDDTVGLFTYSDTLLIWGKKLKGSDGKTRFTIMLPNEGVFIIQLYAHGKTLCKWKVRNLDREGTGSARTSTSRRSALSQKVMDIPFQAEKTFDSLGAYFKQEAKNEKDLYSMIYDWVTQNLTYDYFSVDFDAKNTMNAQINYFYSPIWTFDVNFARYGVCNDFANATAFLCDSAGLEHAKVVGSLYGFNRTEFIREPVGGHAWNSVKLDGVWYLSDPTNGLELTDPKNWVGRALAGGYEHVKSSDEGYKQNGDRTILQDQLVMYLDGFSGVNLDTLAPRNFFVKTNRKLQFEYPGEPGINFSGSATLKGGRDPVLEWSFSYENGSYKASVNFPNDGNYQVEIKAEKPVAASQRTPKASFLYLVAVGDITKFGLKSELKNEFKPSDFIGNFDISIGSSQPQRFRFSQNQTRVTGISDYRGLLLDARLEGNLLFGSWVDQTGLSGWFKLSINISTQKVSGEWGIVGSPSLGSWSGERVKN